MTPQKSHPVRSLAELVLALALLWAAAFPPIASVSAATAFAEDGYACEVGDDLDDELPCDNPWDFNFLDGYYIYDPPLDFCDYFHCISNFWNGAGYVVQCDDLSFSLSGGRPGACADHEGVSRPLYEP